MSKNFDQILDLHTPSTHTNTHQDLALMGESYDVMIYC